MRHQRMESQGLIPDRREADVAVPTRPLAVAPPSRETVFHWRAGAETDPSHAASLDDLLKVREQERQHFAQELHDSAGQLLVALELSIAHLKLVEKNCGHETLIDEIQDNVAQIDREIRSMAFLHYPVELGDRCLHSALQALVLGFGRRTGVHMTFKFAGDRSPVDEALSMAILRVTQEALVNIHRHSRASAAKVSLARRGDLLHLTIADNGVGFPSDVPLQNVRGIGLQGMRHRIDRLGGQFHIRNLKHGAKLSAAVPVSKAELADF
jgi:signal transduction histidine kinase